MKIEILRGDMFESGAASLVCPVNCIGAMGAGLAVAFDKKYPAACREYKHACARWKMSVGEVLPVFPPQLSLLKQDPLIYFVATKGDWRNPSQFDWIMHCSFVLARQAIANARLYKSIAIPAIGVGHGHLRWHEVRPLLEEAAVKIEAAGVKVFLYGPK